MSANEGVLARLDFFRYGGGMGQALVAPSVFALVRNADARRASDQPRARAGMAGLLGSFLLRWRAG